MQTKNKQNKIMAGFPYYDNEDLDRDKTFVKFSLNPLSQNLKLNLAQAASLVVVDTTNFALGDEFTYQFCDQISKVCGTFRAIPDTQTLVFDYNGFCELASKSNVIIETVSHNLGITKDEAIEQAQHFFDNKNVIVQAGGVQGALYKVGSYVQSAGSAGIVANTMGLAKLAGVSGLQILKAQPILAIAIPTTGAIFFYGCGAILGNSTLGKTFVTTGDILVVPMKGVEIVWNHYCNPVIQKIFGIPLILNMSQAFKIGPGYTLKEIAEYIPINKKSILKNVKEKIISWLK
jgi:hypothetical protein